MQQFAGAGDGFARELGRRARPAGRRRRRRAPAPRRAGTHRPGPSRTPRSPRPSAFSSSTHSTAPVARSSACGERALRGADTCAFATATVMPRPIAAGVFGHRAHHAAAADFLRAQRSRARHDRDHQRGRRRRTASAPAGLAERSAASPPPPAWRRRRRPSGGIEANALARQRADLVGRLRLDHHDALGSSPRASQPVSMAPPILPAPASTMVPGCFESVCVFDASWRPSRRPQPGTITRMAGQRAWRTISLLDVPSGATAPVAMRAGRDDGHARRGDDGERYASPCGLEHRGARALRARGLAGPDHELERGVIALAGVERADQHAPRIARSRRRAPPGSTSAWRYMIMPSWVQMIEMPDPHLLVDRAISCCTSARPRGRHFMSKAQARCSASISAIQVKDS